MRASSLLIERPYEKDKGTLIEFLNTIISEQKEQENPAHAEKAAAQERDHRKAGWSVPADGLLCPEIFGLHHQNPERFVWMTWNSRESEINEPRRVHIYTLLKGVIPLVIEELSHTRQPVKGVLPLY